MNRDCSLHENQRKAGTLCRSMYCTKCPPYRGPTTEQKLTEAVELIDELQNDIEKLSKHPCNHEFSPECKGCFYDVLCNEALAKIKAFKEKGE